MFACKHVLILWTSAALLAVIGSNRLKMKQLQADQQTVDSRQAQPLAKFSEPHRHQRAASSHWMPLNDCTDDNDAIVVGRAAEPFDQQQQSDFVYATNWQDVRGHKPDFLDAQALSPLTRSAARSNLEEMLLSPLLTLLPGANNNDDQARSTDAQLLLPRATEKRDDAMPSVIGCDCKIRNDLLDLGREYFPRYLLTAVCQPEAASDWRLTSGAEPPLRCRRGSHCKALDYKVKVLTLRSGKPPTAGMDWTALGAATAVRKMWRFKTVTVAAGCFCSY